MVCHSVSPGSWGKLQIGNFWCRISLQEAYLMTDMTRESKMSWNSSIKVKIPPSLAAVVVWSYFFCLKNYNYQNNIVGGVHRAYKHSYLTRLSTPPSSSIFLKPFEKTLLAEMVFKGKYTKLAITMDFTPLRKWNLCNKCNFFWNSGKRTSELCGIVLDIPK